MRFVIDSFMSAGPINFGSARDEVRKVLGVPVETFLRNDDDEAETDEFEQLGVFVEYDSDGRCIAVEMFSPAEPVLRGRDLLTVPYAQLRVWIEKLDKDAEVDEAGIVSFKLGIGLGADLPKRDKYSPAESVIAFSRGYYDE